MSQTCTAGIPINLADPSKNPKWVQRGLKEWEQANVAEVVECLERRGEVKHLKARSYDRQRPVLSVGTAERDKDSGHGFTKGDRVVLSDHPQARLSASLSGFPLRGVVNGIRGRHVRVNGTLYAPWMWRKA